MSDEITYGTKATPDPVRMVVPREEDFDGYEYLMAPELKRIAEGQMAAHTELFGWLQDEGVTIGYLWKRDGGNSRGKVRLGQVQKTSKLLKRFIPEEYLIWVAANWNAGLPVSAVEIEQTIFHELCHFYQSTKKDGSIVISLTGHDCEYFIAEKTKYGERMNSGKETL